MLPTRTPHSHPCIGRGMPRQLRIAAVLLAFSRLMFQGLATGGLAAVGACGNAAVAQIVSAAPAAVDPADAIVTVDGDPITRGQLNLLLEQRTGDEALQEADPRLVQAAALMLVRRHLALKTLTAMGGQRLAARVERAVQSATEAAGRQGGSLHPQAQRHGLAAVQRELAWQTAWHAYLRSRLTQENLQRFFDAHRTKYDGTRVRLSQIFLPVASGVAAGEDPGTEMLQLQRLAQQIRQSSDVPLAFALAARQHSQGGSADDGGSLGWITANGDLPADIADAALRAEPGEVVGPLSSSLGAHLLLVHQRQAGDKDLLELEDQAPLRRDAADALFRALVRQQAGANVQWIDAASQPPAEMPIIP